MLDFYRDARVQSTEAACAGSQYWSRFAEKVFKEQPGIDRVNIYGYYETDGVHRKGAEEKMHTDVARAWCSIPSLAGTMDVLPSSMTRDKKRYITSTPKPPKVESIITQKL